MPLQHFSIENKPGLEINGCPSARGTNVCSEYRHFKAQCPAGSDQTTVKFKPCKPLFDIATYQI